MNGDRLGRWLEQRGWITAAQLEEASRTRSFFGGDLGTHLVKLGHLDEPDLARALSEITGSPCADDCLRRVDADVVSRVPADIAGRHRVCPFEVDGGTLRIAMANPRDAVALAAVRSSSGLEPEPWVASDYRLTVALGRYYGIRPDGVSGLAVGRMRAGRGRTGTAEIAADVAEGDPGEVGLDGLPLDAELSVHDHPFFGGTSGIDAPPPVREAEAGTKRDAPSPRPGSGTESVGQAPADTLDGLCDRLVAAPDRDAVAAAVLEFCGVWSERCALFAVTREGLRCVAGRGRGLDPDRLRRVVVPLDSGNVLDDALNAGAFYLGPVPPSPANKDLFSLLGGRLPPSILAVPIRLKDRVIALLTLDNDDRPISTADAPQMQRVAAKTGLAFEILLLRGKLRAL